MKIKDIRAVAVNLTPESKTKPRVPRIKGRMGSPARWRAIPNSKEVIGTPNGRASPASSLPKTEPGD